MREISAGIFFVVALGIASVVQAQQPHFVTTADGISVHLNQPPGPFTAGKFIQVQVDVTNDSKQTLLVCRDLDVGNHSCYWDFETRDASGRVLPVLKYAFDRFIEAPVPFPNALISNWIALAPKYKYGTMLGLGLALPGTPKPGHYRVRATLTSDGPSGESVYNDLLHYPNELANLPYTGWKGKAVSNWVSITIIAHRGAQR